MCLEPVRAPFALNRAGDAMAGHSRRDLPYMSADLEGSSEDESWLDEPERYEFEVPGHLAPKLVRLVNLVKEADNAEEAVWLGMSDRKDLARLAGHLEPQMREQGYEGEF